MIGNVSSQTLTCWCEMQKKFINTAAGKSLLPVNHRLEPYATETQLLRCTFENSAKQVVPVFVDTPYIGSDESEKAAAAMTLMKNRK